MVQKEFFAAHEAAKFFRAQVVEHVGQSNRGGQPDGSRTGGQQVGFGKAKPSADGKNVARLVMSWIETDSVRIIANPVSYPVEQLDGAIDIAFSPTHTLEGKLPHRLSVEI